MTTAHHDEPSSSKFAPVDFVLTLILSIYPVISSCLRKSLSPWFGGLWSPRLLGWEAYRSAASARISRFPDFTSGHVLLHTEMLNDHLSYLREGPQSPILEGGGRIIACGLDTQMCEWTGCECKCCHVHRFMRQNREFMRNWSAAARNLMSGYEAGEGYAEGCLY